jgi:putative DNA methylase
MSLSRYRERVHKQFFAEYDRYLDTVTNLDWLSQSSVAEIVRKSLYHFDGTRYQLMAYCIMPNHVHVLFQPDGPQTPCSVPEVADETSDHKSPLSAILHSWKSYTAKEANKVLGRSGGFWQHESYDHWVRDEEELERIVQYIIGNPVKAELVQQPHEWRFSSAHDRFVRDGEKCGWLLPS